MGGPLLHFALQPESETPEDSPLLQVKPLPDASRRCAFQAAISLAEVARVSRLIMNNTSHKPGIDLLARAGNAPASIQRLEPTHYPPLVFADGQITTRQLPQCPQSVLSVVGSAQQSGA